MADKSFQLSDLATVFSGYAFKSKDLIEEGIPIIKIANIQNKSVLKDCPTSLPFSMVLKKLEKYILQKDDILVAMTGAGSLGKIGKMRKVENLYFVNQRVGIIRPLPEKCNPSYLYYVLSQPQFETQIYSIGLGAGQPNISPKQIGTLKIPARPIVDQCRIAFILSTYDDLIENNTRRIQILEEMAQRIYTEWFVHFRFPDHKKVKMEDSELDPIPSVWEASRLGELFNFIKNSTKSGTHLDNRHYVPIDCIGRKELALTENKQWEEAKSSLILFEEDDILFGAMRPYFHKVAIAPFKGITRTTCFVLHPKRTEFYSYALMTLFQDNTIEFANKQSKGATIPYAVWDNSLENMPCSMPSENLLKEYEETVRPMLIMIKKHFFKINNLRKTRDLLLPKLILGEIDVSGMPIPEEIAA